MMIYEVATYWKGELHSLDYLRHVPEIDPSLALVIRPVEPAERLPRDLSGLRDLAGAMAVAVVVHVAFLGFGSWLRGVDPEDEPPSLRTLGALSGNVEIGGSEGSTESGGVPAREVGIIAATVPPAIRPSNTFIAIETAADFGMLGLLRDVQIGSADTSWGTGAGHLFDNDGNMGAGLALSGTGEGSGGRGEGIDIGGIGTIGTSCDDTCIGSGFGRGHGIGLGGHTVQPIRCTLTGGAVTTSGRLPPEIIQRIVRLSMGRFRACYQDGLAKNPSLAGRVAIKFVIDRTGEVEAATDAGSTLPDPNVVACIARAYHSMSFPAPAGGIVNVVYPLELSPE